MAMRAVQVAPTERVVAVRVLRGKLVVESVVRVQELESPILEQHMHRVEVGGVVLIRDRIQARVVVRATVEVPMVEVA
jgi:hypothetical protein